MQDCAFFFSSLTQSIKLFSNLKKIPACFRSDNYLARNFERKSVAAIRSYLHRWTETRINLKKLPLQTLFSPRDRSFTALKQEIFCVEELFVKVAGIFVRCSRFTLLIEHIFVKTQSCKRNRKNTCSIFGEMIKKKVSVNILKKVLIVLKLKKKIF